MPGVPGRSRITGLRLPELLLNRPTTVIEVSKCRPSSGQVSDRPCIRREDLSVDDRDKSSRGSDLDGAKRRTSVGCHQCKRKWASSQRDALVAVKKILRIVLLTSLSPSRFIPISLRHVTSLRLVQRVYVCCVRRRYKGLFQGRGFVCVAATIREPRCKRACAPW